MPEINVTFGVMKKYLSCLLLLSFCWSCSDDAEPLWETTALVVENTAATEAGCQWLIEADGEIFRPTHLNIQYRRPQFEVFIKAEILTSESICGGNSVPIRDLRLEQISPAN